MEIDPRKKRRRLLFAQIRKAGPIARVDLADNTGISQPTITTITAELLRKRLIEEVTPEDSSLGSRRGRPRIALQVRPDAHIVVGLKLGDTSISAVLCDFSNAVLAERNVPTTGRALSQEDACRMVETVVRELAADVGLRPNDISGLGIGLPGVVDARAGIVSWSPVLKGRDMAFREALEHRLGVPVFVDNDANLVAVAEKYHGVGKDVDDFLVVTIEEGVGLGIVIGDEVYRGSRSFASEFGHIKVQPGGALCRCGQRGCLEAYIADYALLREASYVPEFSDARGSRAERLAALMSAARSGHETAQSIVDRAERYFAIGLANLITLLDPQLIVLSGERMSYDYLVAEDVLRAIRDFLHPADVPAPEILLHKWGNMMWARGAAAYAIDGVAERIIGELDRDAA